MHFPLPTGICRKVCRPARRPPRVTRINDVIRMARAAVSHGAVPCDVAIGVAAAVGCEPCLDQMKEVDLGIEAIIEDADEVKEALLDLLKVLYGDRPKFERILEDDKLDTLL